MGLSGQSAIPCSKRRRLSRIGLRRVVKNWLSESYDYVRFPSSRRHKVALSLYIYGFDRRKHLLTACIRYYYPLTDFWQFRFIFVYSDMIVVHISSPTKKKQMNQRENSSSKLCNCALSHSKILIESAEPRPDNGVGSVICQRRETLTTLLKGARANNRTKMAWLRALWGVLMITICINNKRLSQHCALTSSVRR